MTDEQCAEIVKAIYRASVAAAIGRLGIVFAIFVLTLTIGGKAHAADLPLLKPRHPPELCLTPGKEPFAGQTGLVDVEGLSGMRWVFQR